MPTSPGPERVDDPEVPPLPPPTTPPPSTTNTDDGTIDHESLGIRIVEGPQGTMAIIPPESLEDLKARAIAEDKEAERAVRRYQVKDPPPRYKAKEPPTAKSSDDVEHKPAPTTPKAATLKNKGAPSVPPPSLAKATPPVGETIPPLLDCLSRRILSSLNQTASKDRAVDREAGNQLVLLMKSCGNSHKMRARGVRKQKQR